MKKLKLIYVFDAHCSWCFAFSKVVLAIQEKYADTFDFEVLSGGMVVGDRTGPIKNAAPPNLLEIYGRIESMTGTKFSEAYLAKAEKGDSLVNSEIPAAALATFKKYRPEKAMTFAHDLQEKLFVDAMDVDDSELYHSLANEFGIDAAAFYQEMQTSDAKEAARYEFSLAKQLQVTGYPQLLVQTGDTHFYLIARGYIDSGTLEERLQKVMGELAKAQ
ncbi:MAG: DsbA family protein [Bacteroidota bacterium]